MARTRTVFHLKRTGDYGTLFPPVTVTTDEMEPLRVTNYHHIPDLFQKRFQIKLSDGRLIGVRHFATFESKGRRLFLLHTEEQVWPENVNGWILTNEEGDIFPGLRPNGEGDPRNETRKPETGPAA
jgi:hypothetical protein